MSCCDAPSLRESRKGKDKPTGGNWFEEIADVYVDSAVLRVGLHHYAFGPPRPGFLIATGAVDVAINFHEDDIDEVISAFRSLKRRLQASARKDGSSQQGDRS